MRAKTSRSRYRRKKLFYQLLSIIVLFVLLGGVVEVIRLFQLHLEEGNLQKEIDRLKITNRNLQDMRKGLTEDQGEIERRAREDLGMIKEGETLFRVIKPDLQEEETGKDRRSEDLDRLK